MTQTNQPSAGAPGTAHALWYDGFPCVLAHEYHRLQGLLRNGQRYGAYYQAKDVIESTLKYVLLAACAWAKSANIEGREEGYEMALASKTPSLGMWVSFGRQMQDFFSQPRFRQGGMPAPLWTLLNRTVSWMDKNSLVHWRNEGIGHGALAFDDSPEFCEDLARVERIITEFYKRNADLFAMHTIVSGSTPLPGHANARSLREETGELALRLPALPDIPLFPFMVHIRHGVFFFDEVESRSLTRMINYPVGSDAIVSSPEVTGYYARLSDILSQSGLDIGRDVASGYLSEGESALLDRLNADEHYVSPRHLTAWLKDALGRHKKGAFLLTMARGCGKSTFSQKLSRLYKNPETLANDLDVRTYHFFRTQFDGLSEFKEGLEDQWAREYSEGGQTRMGRFRRFEHYERDAENLAVPPARQMALFLEAVLGEVRSSRGKRRILLVLDGLDEISDNDIWPYLACGDLLPEGVYLLLTCRSAGGEPLPAGFDARLDALGVCERRTFSTDDPDNLAFLRAYARARVPRAGEQELQQLLALSENRVLYLSMYCRLMQGGLSVRDLGHGQTAVARYIAELETRYGEARRALLHKLLLALCTFGEEEPLSLGEMAYLTGNGGVTLELVAMMNDLSPLLYTQRGYSVGGRRYAGVNRYRLVNSQLAEAVHSLLAEESAAFILMKTEKALLRTGDAAPVTDGQRLVLAHLADMRLAESLPLPQDLAQLQNLVTFIQTEYTLPLRDAFDTERARMTCAQAIAISRALPAQNAQDLAAYAYCHMGEISRSAGMPEHALTMFTSASELLAQAEEDNLSLLTVNLRRGQLMLELSGRSEQAQDLLYAAYARLRVLALPDKSVSMPVSEAVMLFGESCIVLAMYLQHELRDNHELAVEFKPFAVMHEILQLHEEAAHAFSKHDIQSLSMLSRLYDSLGDCIGVFSSVLSKFYVTLPSPCNEAVVHDAYLHSLQLSKMLPPREQNRMIAKPLGPKTDLHLIQTQCLLLEAMDRDGLLPNRLDLARAYMHLEEKTEDYDVKLSCCEKAIALYEEARKLDSLNPEDSLKACDAELAAAKYHYMLNDRPQGASVLPLEELILPLYIKRAQCAKQLFDSTMAQGYPNYDYYSAYTSECWRIRGLLKKQKHTEEARQWRNNALSFIKTYLSIRLSSSVKRVFNWLKPLLLPICLVYVLSLLEIMQLIKPPLSSILAYGTLIYLFVQLFRVRKSYKAAEASAHCKNPQAQSEEAKPIRLRHLPRLSRLLLRLNWQIPLFSAVICAFYIAHKKGWSLSTLFALHSPRTLDHLKEIFAPDVLCLLILCALIHELFTPFIMHHIILRLKLRKIRRALAKLRDRLLGDPPDGH